MVSCDSVGDIGEVPRERGAPPFEPLHGWNEEREPERAAECHGDEHTEREPLADLGAGARLLGPRRLHDRARATVGAAKDEDTA